MATADGRQCRSDGRGLAAVRAGLLLAGMSLGSSSLQAGPLALPSMLTPHRAVYDMRLNTAKPGGEVTAASGVMTYSLADACDGWTVENRTVLSFSYLEGPPVLTQWESVSWESKDGRVFRFRGRSLRDGVLSDEVAGLARRGDGGRSGQVRFSKPEERVMPLPAGTVFPTEHALHLLEAARSGHPVMARPLFDGVGIYASFYVNALIGKPEAAPAQPLPRPELRAADLLHQPSWRVQMAYFPNGSVELQPDYEVTERFYQNGIADDLVQSFGSFSLRGRLKSLELLPRPNC